MLENPPYPLLSLKLLGSICPCLEKSDDGPARRAAWAFSHSGVPIRWHRRLRGSGGGASGAAHAVGGFLSGMFGSSSSSSGGGRGGGGGLGSGGDRYEPCEGATLSVADSPSGPQLVISPPGMTSGMREKRIPLKCIKSVEARRTGGITSVSRSAIKIVDNRGRKVLRFDVLKESTSSSQQPSDDTAAEDEWENENGESITSEVAAEDAEESIRDDTIDRLQLLMEWERRRQAYIVTLGEDDDEAEEEAYADEYDDDNDDDDGENSANSGRGGKKKGVLAEQAQKMKHFAQREIEMKKTKKERENRKAKYVKEAGGLKYTAIAMANRS